MVAKPAFAFISAATLALFCATTMVRAGPAPPQVEEAIRLYLETHPEALGPAIDKYLADHPEALAKALRALVKRGPTGASGVDNRQVIAENAGALYSAPLQTALGAPEGATTLVEFFDFNCGYCRKALKDTLALIAEDPALRIVLKDYPILGLIRWKRRRWRSPCRCGGRTPRSRWSSIAGC